MIEIKVCVGSSCHIRGGTQTLKALEALIEDSGLSDKIDLRADLCLDNCLQAPNVIVDGTLFGGITPDVAEEFFKTHILTATLKRDL
jgi:NADH:ubiquinone oxidoreductase subunit E